MGARKAILERTEDRELWQNVPFTGCDGVTKTGQDWVKRGMLAATVITPPATGIALEILVKATNAGVMPPERTTIPPRSFPPIEDLRDKRKT